MYQFPACYFYGLLFLLVEKPAPGEQVEQKPPGLPVVSLQEAQCVFPILDRADKGTQSRKVRIANLLEEGLPLPLGELRHVHIFSTVEELVRFAVQASQLFARDLRPHIVVIKAGHHQLQEDQTQLVEVFGRRLSGEGPQICKSLRQAEVCYLHSHLLYLLLVGGGQPEGFGRQAVVDVASAVEVIH
eukprot:CAMPEP_0173173738 /NCGR_PEP_ID=MMETSP1141-20130122/2987_1 /TAXON_ID=483371 /ORGANISM="non described non described, Strain CCMP2298" /LENGTH=186 /DNA_ID=CAMNT_0014095831 /DNA_START=217 /DNA_END=777 /DNA_ORIENTATION=-